MADSEKRFGVAGKMEPAVVADERYKGDGLGRPLPTVDAIFTEAKALHLPIERTPTSGNAMLAVHVEGALHSAMERVEVIADRDGFIAGWRKGGCACAADHARLKKLEDGDMRLAFFRKGVIAGYVTVPSKEKARRLSALSAATKVVSWLSSCGIVPSISIHGDSLELKVKTLSDGLVAFSFTRMGRDYAMDSLSIGGKNMKAYCLDSSTSIFMGWGASLNVKVVDGDGKQGIEEIMVGIPGFEEWLGEELGKALD